MDRPRLGHFPFLNCHPMYLGLVETGVINDVQLVHGTPAEIARLMRAGELDAALLSLIEYLRHADQFLLLPGLAIGAEGSVQSVQLVGKVAPRSMRGPVAMTDASATSHVLLALLLKELWAVAVKCSSCEVDFPDVLGHAEAALLIGDDALRVAAQQPSGLHMTDLGKAWAELTGLPMVFAVWAVRREFARSQPALTSKLAEGLSASLAWSLGHLADVIAYSSSRQPFSPAYLDAYYKNLDYGLGAAAERGILAFAEKSLRHGFISSVPELEFSEAQ